MQMALKHFVSGMKCNSKINSLQDFEHQIIYMKSEVLMAGLQYCTLLGNKAAWNSTIEMKAIFSTQTTWRHISDDHNLICVTIARARAHTHTHTHTHTFLDHSKLICYL